MPMMALSGVRSSWLTIEMKRRLAWLAASARASASNMLRHQRQHVEAERDDMPTSRPTPSRGARRQKSLHAEHHAEARHAHGQREISR